MSETTYIARCVRSGSWWAVDIADLSGTHLQGGNTQAKHLHEVPDRAREVIALLLDIPEDSIVVRIESHENELSVSGDHLTIDQQIYVQGYQANGAGLATVLAELYTLPANRAIWRKGWEDAAQGVYDPPAAPTK